MSGPVLRPASDFPAEELTQLFNRCYADYYVPLQLTEAVFVEMVAAYDLSLAESRVWAGDRGPSGFALLGIRGDSGWIGGMGVAPEARGGGAGRVLMDAVLERARARGLSDVTLEVLEQNAPAIRIYEAIGFADRRRLEVWARPPGPATPEAGVDVRDLPVERVLAHRRHERESPLPWQRAVPVLERAAPACAALGVERGGALECWALYRARGPQVQLLDAGVAPGAAAGSLAATLARLAERHPEAAMAIVNLPAGDPAGAALAAAGFAVRWRQREMAWPVTNSAPIRSP